MFCAISICSIVFFFFFKQKTAYEMRISDWSSDVCSSDLEHHVHADEEDPEMELAEELVVHLARHLREPVIEAGEEAEHRAEAEHVVEMRHHVIGILDRKSVV